MPIQILAFAGSLRAASFNRKLLAIAVERARSAGAAVDLLDLREVQMPLYDGDLEAASGLPAGALELRRRILAAHAVLIASPEYNGSVPGTLKNAIDWSSRPPDQPWKGKVILAVSASAGPYGGARMLPDLRKILSVLGGVVIPASASLTRAGSAFDDAGKLVDPASAKAVEGAVAQLLEMTAKLSGAGAT